MRAPCKVEGCGRESRGRGWCATHWRRWRVHGSPDVVLQKGIDYRVAPECSVEGCDATSKARRLCSKHYHRWRRHGDPLAVSELRGRPLSGDVPTWTTIHKRLTRECGRASEQLCVDCREPAAEWSYDHQDPDQLVGDVRGVLLAYSLDLTRYQPRCVGCHRRFDRRHVLDHPGVRFRVTAIEVPA